MLMVSACVSVCGFIILHVCNAAEAYRSFKQRINVILQLWLGSCQMPNQSLAAALPNLVWQLPKLVWQVWQLPNLSLAAAKLSLAAAKLCLAAAKLSLAAAKVSWQLPNLSLAAAKPEFGSCQT